MSERAVATYDVATSRFGVVFRGQFTPYSSHTAAVVAATDFNHAIDKAEREAEERIVRRVKK
jgi:hypothetical protein